MNNIKIYKFGGAVLNSLNGFRNMLKILQEQQSDKLLLVVSAFAKSTRELRKAGEQASLGRLATAEEVIEKLILEYLYFAENLINDATLLNLIKAEIENAHCEIKKLLRGIAIVRELTPRTLDLLMSYGEKLSLLIAYHYLKINGINIASIDSSQVIKTNSNFGKASPNYPITANNVAKQILPLFDEYSTVVTQGFVASDSNNEITTMGIESSNLSAAIYAQYLECKEIILFTDVDGIRNADPKLQNDTSLVKQLSYRQAYLLGLNGIKLIFPQMVKLAKRAGIKIIIKSGISESSDKTIISTEKNNDDISITINKGEKYLYQCYLPRHLNSNRFMQRYFYKKHNLKDLGFQIISAEDSYCIVELLDKEAIKGAIQCEKISIISLNGGKLPQGMLNSEKVFYESTFANVKNFYFRK